ncbi:MAG: 30S ribosomal protein S8 [Candidatus Hydrothermae bacterium]|nr:30S ribosomal protein S8 [Candidatus Hydrothermae bacterium]
MTDPIADMLTRIRNAIRARHIQVEIRPVSKMKTGIAHILKREGFIEDYRVEGEGKDASILITLKYTSEGQPLISDLQRISKPGRRVYVGKDEVPWVKNGLGIAILSTSRGLLTDREARRLGTGGELLLYVW